MKFEREVEYIEKGIEKIARKEKKLDIKGGERAKERDRKRERKRENERNQERIQIRNQNKNNVMLGYDVNHYFPISSGIAKLIGYLYRIAAVVLSSWQDLFT